VASKKIKINTSRVARRYARRALRKASLKTAKLALRGRRAARRLLARGRGFRYVKVKSVNGKVKVVRIARRSGSRRSSRRLRVFAG